jgi:hypothetical protein
MNNFDQIKPLSDKIDALLLNIKDAKPNLYKEYTLIVDNAINGFIDLGAEYIKNNPQEFEIFLKKLNDIITILEFIKKKENISEVKLTHLIKQLLLEEKEKRDRCLRIADRKFDKPSAYKSGAVVRCRQGKIWKDLKETDDPQSGKAAPYGSGYARLKEIIRKVIQEDESLYKWFKRSGPKGKEKGWVDCNAPDGKGGYKSCGRKEGEKRAKYPACRPTPAGCKKKGKGKTWGKTK